MLWVSLSLSNLSCNPRSYHVILDISTPNHFILKSKWFPGENIGSRQLCSTSTYDGDDLCTSPNYCKLVLGEIDNNWDEHQRVRFQFPTFISGG